MFKMNWDACIICQEPGGDLRCPAASLQNNGFEIYSDILSIVEEFRKLDKLPIEINLKGEGKPDILVDKCAKWHKNCKLKFVASKLKNDSPGHRGRKRKSLDKEETRSSKRTSLGDQRQYKCIFCLKSDGKLHECSTIEFYSRLRTMATNLEDSELLARISGGDLIAIEAKYHFECVSKYKSRHRTHERTSSVKTHEVMFKEIEATAFIELVSHIEGCIEENKFVFQLSELHALYETRLKHLGYQKSVNKTRLKQQILSYFSEDCQGQTDGRSTIIVFQEGMKRLMKEALNARDYLNEAIDMNKLVKRIRQDMFDFTMPFRFDGSFPDDCQEESVPLSLKTLVSMLINGPNMKHQITTESQICQTISQLIYFNSKKRFTPNVSMNRTSKKREPPLPIYLGLSIHTKTRSKLLVNSLSKMGVGITYKRVMEIENDLASSVCKRFEEEGIVCPSNLRKYIFTVGALDNIDHNPSSTTSKGSFHGTGISIFQFPTKDNPGIGRERITIGHHTAKDFSLPDKYAVVPAVSCKTTEFGVPDTLISDKQAGSLQEAQNQETRWVEHAAAFLNKDKLEKGDKMTWASFHSLSDTSETKPAIIALLPLFYEKAATMAMIKHGKDIQKNITEYINPGQIPVMAFDQPLFALAKFSQWCWPDTHGEDKYVVMFGGLHIEMALWNTIGTYLDGSGWTTALSDSGIAGTGTADSYLKASHLTRTRHSHQVTALTLATIQCEAFAQAETNTPMQDWKNDMIKRSPTFRYWNTLLEFEMLAFVLIRAHRTRNFDLYIESLECLAPWFFCMDRTNYARWIPIHIRDMKSLTNQMHEELAKYWVIQKTKHKFSSIPLDQAHEQNNELIKGSGGAVGLTENPMAFRRWMVAGPEQARLIQEFENQYLDLDDTDLEPRGQGFSNQESFFDQVTSLRTTFHEFGNPFLHDGPELVCLDTSNCASDEAVKSIQNLEHIGKEQYNQYVKDVITDRSVSIHQPIKRNSVSLFKASSHKSISRTKGQVTDLKSNCHLFSQLYIASKFRDGDLEDFFSHENHPWPPALSDHGQIKLPTKSDLLVQFDAVSEHNIPGEFDCKVFDGAAVVHILSTRQTTTFSEYAENVFINWTKRELNSAQRIDIVWDIYKKGSLKECARGKRGTGIRKKVEERTKMPVNFQDFLKDSTNKEELFNLLTQKVSLSEYPAEKEVYITSGKSLSHKLYLNSNHHHPTWFLHMY